MISAVVAVDNNWGIGFEGQLLERLPPDMKYFKELTTGHVIIMGRKTWDSLPNKPLPNRKNIIITHNINNPAINSTTSFGCTLEELLRGNLKEFKEDIFIIGGGEIYKQLLPYCDRVYVTKILKDFENVDTYFPNLDISPNWAPAMISAIHTHKDLSYQFWEYDSI